MKHLFTYFLLLIAYGGYSQPSVRFKKFYDLSPFYASQAFDVMTTDSGYIVSGITVDTSAGYGYNRLTIIGTDTAGNLQWTKHYGTPAFQYAHDYSTKWLVEKGGFFFLTCPILKAGTNANSVLIKFNLNGDTIWQKEYSEPGIYWYVTQAISSTPDNGFIMTGLISDSTYSAMLLLKTDSLGNQQWRKKINNGTFLIEGRSVVYDTITNKYVIVGLHNPVATANIQSLIIVTDSLGNKLSQDCFTGPNGGSLTSLFISDDNNFVACGANYTGIPVGSFEKTLAKVVKFDINGNVIWNKDYGDPSILNYFGSIMKLPSGEIVMVGQYDSLQDAGIGLHGLYIIQKCDGNGDSIWSRCIDVIPGVGDQNICNSMDLTSDGGFILTGWYFGSTPSVYCLVKLDSFGCDSVDCQLVSINEQESLSETEVYPNPFTNELIISGDNYYKNITILLYNTLGQQIYSKTCSFDLETNLSIPGLTPGIYLITLKNDSGLLFTRKLIKADVK